MYKVRGNSVKFICNEEKCRELSYSFLLLLQNMASTMELASYAMQSKTMLVDTDFCHVALMPSNLFQSLNRLF